MQAQLIGGKRDVAAKLPHNAISARPKLKSMSWVSGYASRSDTPA
jgi:hypothetical protein